MNKPKCPICGWNRNELVILGVWGDSKRKVFKCLKCSSVYLVPMMTDREMDNFYSKYNEHIKKRIPDKNARLDMQKRVILAAKRQVKLLRPYLTKKRILCDIGAADGEFLQEARRYVKDIIAIEPSVDATPRLRARKIRNFRWLKDVDPEKLKFDAVALFHTFEHLRDPKGYLLELKKYLNPGAYVFIEVPNIDDALLKLYKIENFKKYYFQLMHCFYYNPGTLTNILKLSGFKPINIIPVQRYGISNHLNWLLTHKPGGNVILEKIFAELDKSYREIIKRNKLSDTMVGIFRV